MPTSRSELNPEEMLVELKKLRFKSKLQDSLATELEREKLAVIEAKSLIQRKSNELESTVKKLKFESQLRRNLSSELERQEAAAVKAQEIALQKKSEIEDISSRLSRYLPSRLYDSIFSGEQQVEVSSKRKKLTFFFSDLVGFTRISDSLESEEVTDMLNYYLTEMASIALEFGGTIDKFVGDAIVIYFGDESESEVQENAFKCVSMAVAMQERMKGLERIWAPKYGLKDPLQMRVGINTGYCTVGNFGSKDRLDYTVIGGQVNLAARLESAARPGSILVSFDTFSQISGDIECIELEPATLKGIKEEVRVFEVCSNKKNTLRVLRIATENAECRINVDQLSGQEFEELMEFVENVRRSIKK
jgi:adenylate cyclase